MDIKAELSYLSHLPTFYFKRLVDKWEKTSIELEPNGLFSKENQETTINIINNMKATNIKKLKKIADVLDVSNVWWDVYQISKIKPLSNLQKRKKTFGVEEYVSEDFTKIKGIFSIKELSEQAILVIVEFSSRSTLLRRTFRFLYLPTVKKILLEPKDLAIEILKGEILPFVTKEPEKLTKKPIRSRIIGSIAKKRDEEELSIPLTHLKIKISLETSGIEGLNQIIIQGDDVLRGAETLEQRHEISLDFLNSGPWIGAGTDDFTFEVRKGIQIHKMEEQSLANLAKVLSWL